MATKADFYQSHLDRVSRSFAFCIRQLPSPLKEWVGLSYLLCRVADTIEDAPWESSLAQFEVFERFDQALLSPERLESVQAWVSLFPPGLPEGEILLLGD